MECVILFRYHTGKVDFIIADESAKPAVFSNMDEAIEFAQSSKFLQAVPYQIVELDEL